MVHGGHVKLGYTVNVILNADAGAVIQVENLSQHNGFKDKPTKFSLGIITGLQCDAFVARPRRQSSCALTVLVDLSSGSRSLFKVG